MKANSIHDNPHYLSRIGRFLPPGSDEAAVHSHLQGVQTLLQKWNCAEELCLAGLCHNVYDDATYATAENRAYMKELVGAGSESVIYYFAALKPASIFSVLGQSEPYAIEDQFVKTTRTLSRRELSDMLMLALANWLEQRPRLPSQQRQVFIKPFEAAKDLLSPEAYRDFVEQTRES
jgi:hypothetical protein